MDRQQKELLVIAGIAAAAAAGVAAGAVAHRHRQPERLLRSGRHKLEDLLHSDTLQDIPDKIAAALPGHRRHRWHSRRPFAGFRDRDTLSDFLDKVVDSLPRKEAERMAQRVKERLGHW